MKRRLLHRTFAVAIAATVSSSWLAACGARAPTVARSSQPAPVADAPVAAACSRVRRAVGALAILRAALARCRGQLVRLPGHAAIARAPHAARSAGPPTAYELAVASERWGGRLATIWARVEEQRREAAAALAAGARLGQWNALYYSWWGDASGMPQPLASWRRVPADIVPRLRPLRRTCERFANALEGHPMPEELDDDCRLATSLTPEHLQAAARRDLAHARARLTRALRTLHRQGYIAHGDWRAMHDIRSLDRMQREAHAHMQRVAGASLALPSLEVPTPEDRARAIEPWTRQGFAYSSEPTLPVPLRQRLTSALTGIGARLLGYRASLFRVAPGEVDEEGTPMRSEWTVQALVQVSGDRWCRVYIVRIDAEDGRSAELARLGADATVFTIVACPR